jgi:hypothetical protein
MIAVNVVSRLVMRQAAALVVGVAIGSAAFGVVFRLSRETGLGVGGGHHCLYSVLGVARCC